MQPLKIGDIVTHKSEPDICGVITSINGNWCAIDYSISMPPDRAELEELNIIKQQAPTIDDEIADENQNAARSVVWQFQKTNLFFGN